MDTRLHSVYVRIERKQFAFDLKENPNGTFLRITEEVGGRRNSIIIPAAGLELFHEALNEVIKVQPDSRGASSNPSTGASEH